MAHLEDEGPWIVDPVAYADVAQPVQGGQLDLANHRVKHKAWTHLKLTVRKNFILKWRRPVKFVGEVLTVPLFMLALSIVFFLTSLYNHAPVNYAAQDPFDTLHAVNQLVCITGHHDTGPFIRCSPQSAAACRNHTTSLLTLPHRNNSYLCLQVERVNITETGDVQCQTCEALVAKVSELSNPTPVQGIDEYLALQLLTLRVVGTGELAHLRSTIDSLRHFGKLHFAAPPALCNATRGLIAAFKERYLLFSAIYDAEAPGESGCPGVWTSEGAAVDYVRTTGAADTWGVVVLHEMMGKVDYTVRLNYTATPYTRHTMAKHLSGLADYPYLKYINSGFTTLQQAIFEHITGNQRGVPVMSSPMPTEYYYQSEFYEKSKHYLSLLFTLAFLPPLARIVAGIVEEKERRLREVMLIMGLSRTAFYVSWFVTCAFLQTVSTVVLTALVSLTFLKQTSFMVTFVLFESFAINIVAMALLFSVFFSKTRVARIVSSLIMVLMTVPKFALPDELTVETMQGISMLSPSAFAYGASLLVKYASTGNGATMADFLKDDYSFGTSLFFINLDTVIYLVLAWYLDNVLPSEFGVKRHPLFLFQKSYWLGKRERPPPTPSSPREGYRPVVETFDEVTTEKMGRRERIRINGLTKVFQGEEGPIVAVDHLGDGLPTEALSFYEGQIQCVLGHNGAGKTTLINMLTGMLPPSEGECEVWGRSIHDEIDAIREDLGLCPQHNTLWPLLTPMEHLDFYGRLKGVPRGTIGKLSEQLLELVGLGEKKDAWSGTLSGGQKRKLSVAIALIGGPRLVVLDEPTAGMDVEARRAMWQLLRRREILDGRCIVLTTHYMDEADLLGDSIVLMDQGRLHSWGSPFFLKAKHGVGYNLSVAMKTGCDPQKVEAVVRKHVGEAKILSMTGNELHLQLPMERPVTDSNIVGLVKMKDFPEEAAELLVATIDPIVRREVLSTVVTDPVVSPKVRNKVHMLLEECRAQTAFPALFEDLDSSMRDLKIESYGVGMTTLEEVFMKVALGSEPANEKKTSSGGVGEERFKLYSLWENEAERKKGWHLCFQQLCGLLVKRFHCARRDRRTLFFQFVMPIFFISAALLFLRINPPSQPSVILSPGTLYDLPTPLYYAPPDAPLFASCESGVGVCGFGEEYTLKNASQLAGEPLPTAVNLSHYLLQSYNAHGDESRGGAIHYGARGFSTVLHNATYMAALPTVLNSLHQALHRRAVNDSVDASYTVRNHPLPYSAHQHRKADAVQVVISGLFILMPFIFIPSNFVSFVIKERNSKAKHVQMVAGVSRVVYWGSTMLFDLALYLVPTCLAFVVFVVDGRSEFVGDMHSLEASVLLFSLYGMSCTAWSYVQSYLVQPGMVFTFNFISGFFIVLMSQILDYFDSTKAANSALKYIYRLLPGFCLGDGVISLLQNKLRRGFNAAEDPLSWDVAGADIVFLGALFPVFVAMLIALDTPRLVTRIVQICRPPPPQPLESPLYEMGTIDASPLLDEPEVSFEGTDLDLHEERVAVYQEGGRKGDLVTVQGLRKVWHKKGSSDEKVAVDNVSFGVKRGELFAFLGTNGAGKTTTLSILSGEFPPTDGRCLLGYDPKTGHGFDVVRQPDDARQSLGLCPQFDALLDHMTPEEHLQLFGRLRGMPADKVEESTQLLLETLGIARHRTKTAKSLSGGNRRKLCVAIALMGGPPVVFLDEPSAGMDPVARRGLWGALESICRERSVVLTTHHLEEVEGLSHLQHRVSVMVNGSLRGLGTLQRLKSKFGDAYELELKVSRTSYEGPVYRLVSSEFPLSSLEECTNQRLTFKLPKPVALSKVFQVIEGCREAWGITDYSINETSLEQVFLKLSEPKPCVPASYGPADVEVPLQEMRTDLQLRYPTAYYSPTLPKVTRAIDQD